MNCAKYDPSYTDLLMIPKEIFIKVCDVRDKTLLFIWTFIRIVFLSIITYLLYNPQSTILALVCSLLVIYIMFNILLLILIIFKDRIKISKYCFAR